MRSRFDVPELFSNENLAGLLVSRPSWARHRGLMRDQNVFLFYVRDDRLHCDLVPVAQCSDPHKWYLELSKRNRSKSGPSMLIVVGGWLAPREMSCTYGSSVASVVKDALRAAYAVRRVASSIRLLSGQRRKIPFDPWRAAAAASVKVVSAPSAAPYSGRVVAKDDGFVIELRAGDPHVRQRFTLSHELAHLCFFGCALEVPPGYSVRLAASEAERWEEKLCDRIAGELLLPRSALGRVARELATEASGRPGLPELRRLAEVFHVSCMAAERRLTECRIWISALPRIRAALYSKSHAERASPGVAHGQRPIIQ